MIKNLFEWISKLWGMKLSYKKFLYANELKLINHKIMKIVLHEVENIIVAGGWRWDDYRDFIIIFDAVLIKSWKFYESQRKRGWEQKNAEMTRKLCTLPLTQMQTWHVYKSTINLGKKEINLRGGKNMKTTSRMHWGSLMMDWRLFNFLPHFVSITMNKCAYKLWIRNWIEKGMR